MNIIRKYWDSVYSYILILMPGFCACAGTYWTICKLLGWYTHLGWVQILTFDFTQIIYFIIAIYFIYKNRKDHSYIPMHLPFVKGFVVIALFIQYNFILYLFPSPHVWECTFLFLTFYVFFMDSKLMLFDLFAFFLFLFIAHIIRPEEFLPQDDSNITEIITYRVIIYWLTAICILIITYFMERFLMQAQESSEENVHLMEKQLKYYRNIELMDTELRKFRHDIKNHFMCMEYLFRNDKQEELDQYFLDLQQAFSFRDKLYVSGNDIIDAILNHDIHSNCNENVKITVYGNLPPLNTVSAMDLCTVFSNLLSNAITSVNQVHNNQEPEIIIRFMGGKSYFSITISNSVIEEELDKKKKKKDRNHGHGIHNIKETIEKYNGSFEQNIEGNMFISSVYFPI